MNSKKKSLSIVIPCHNEEEVIFQSYLTIRNLVDGWMDDIICSYEIVLVNNGSTDKTLPEMLRIYDIDENVVILDLRNNFGYQGSITAGLFNATKEMIVTIDADLQDNPEKIEEMILEHYKGYDLVLGVRNNRDSDGFFKRHTAHYYYKLINKLGVRSVYNHGDFRLMSRSLLGDFKKYNEKNRYIRSLVTLLENKYSCVYYDRVKRKSGKSKFDIKSLLSLAIDGITSFSTLPIKFISFFGFGIFLLSILGMFYILYEKYVNNVSVPGWAFTSMIVMFFGGINSLFLGIVGEYVGKSYVETKQRPIFIIRKEYRRIEDSKIC